MSDLGDIETILWNMYSRYRDGASSQYSAKIEHDILDAYIAVLKLRDTLDDTPPSYHR